MMLLVAATARCEKSALAWSRACDWPSTLKSKQSLCDASSHLQDTANCWALSLPTVCRRPSLGTMCWPKAMTRKATRETHLRCSSWLTALLLV